MHWPQQKTVRLPECRCGGKALQPADFNLNAATNQAELAEDWAKSAGFAGVAAIDGGNRGERGKLHRGHSRQSSNEKRAQIIHESDSMIAAATRTVAASGRWGLFRPQQWIKRVEQLAPA
jgi:hypothetical protein